MNQNARKKREKNNELDAQLRTGYVPTTNQEQRF
jgi:hypothetical protein